MHSNPRRALMRSGLTALALIPKPVLAVSADQQSPRRSWRGARVGSQDDQARQFVSDMVDFFRRQLAP
jgi:hypothetical protein